MKNEIISQYRAGLKMLTDAVERCPENLWNSEQYENRYWRIVYHTLHYTALYLSGGLDNFKSWKIHRKDYHILGPVSYNGEPIEIPVIYTREELLEYAGVIHDDCEKAVNDIPLDKNSGFDWLPINRFELHLYNIRHLQHHTGQLIEQLHHHGIQGIKWIKAG
jgi:hypothetical protein